jgi:hypothetical protein
LREGWAAEASLDADPAPTKVSIFVTDKACNQILTKRNKFNSKLAKIPD